MKKIYLLMVMALCLFTGCVEKVSDPVFKEGEFYIHVDSWQSKITAVQGRSMTKEVMVSPADGSVKCSWTIDSKVISNHEKMVWTFNQVGTYTLVFTAEKDGVTKTRTAVVTVEPNTENE